MVKGAGISVVMPLFNKGNCVGRALRSVLDQTVPCGEIIVVDDGSTDGGHQVVERLEDARIKLFRQQNGGPSVARNKGIEEAQSELIAFLDADDEWKPWFLETILSLRAKYAQAGAYATAFEIQEPQGRVRIPSFREIPAPPWEGIIPNYFRSAIGHTPVWTSAVTVRREVFERVGRFVLCPGLGQDVELWGRIALQYPIAFSWRASAVYHQEAENRRCGKIFTHVFASSGFEQAIRAHPVPPPIRADVEEYLAHGKLIAASRYVVSGQPKIARGILRHCKTRRFLKRKLWWQFWSLLPARCVSLAWGGKRWLQMYLTSSHPRTSPRYCP